MAVKDLYALDIELLVQLVRLAWRLDRIVFVTVDFNLDEVYLAVCELLVKYLVDQAARVSVLNIASEEESVHLILIHEAVDVVIVKSCALAWV